MILNKKQFAIALPIIIILGAYAYFVPIHNLMAIQEDQYKCHNPKSMWLQLDNGTIIPCPNTKGFIQNYTSFNRTNT